MEIKPLAKKTGRWAVEGLPADFVLNILTIAMGAAWAAHTDIHRVNCKCAIKTVLEPHSGIQQWSAAMDPPPLEAPWSYRSRHTSVVQSARQTTT